MSKIRIKFTSILKFCEYRMPLVVRVSQKDAFFQMTNMG